MSDSITHPSDGVFEEINKKCNDVLDKLYGDAGLVEIDKALYTTMLK